MSYVFSWDGLTGVPPFCLPVVLRIFSRAKKWPFWGDFWMEILVYPNVKISNKKKLPRSSYETVWNNGQVCLDYPKIFKIEICFFLLMADPN